MDEDQFWQIIESARRASDSDDAHQLDIIREELVKLPVEAIVAFDEIVHRLLATSYRTDLWAAAYIINGGCSDDGFEDFRAWLIAQGRSAFEEALHNPESLKELIVMHPDWYAELEQFLYVALEAYEQKTGDEMPIRLLPDKELTGADWDADSVEQLFPELARAAQRRFHDDE